MGCMFGPVRWYCHSMCGWQEVNYNTRLFLRWLHSLTRHLMMLWLTVWPVQVHIHDFKERQHWNIHLGPCMFGHWHSFHHFSSVTQQNNSKWNNQDEDEVQTLRFNSGRWTKILHKMFYVGITPIFKGSNVIGQINMIIHKMFIFIIVLRILCRRWLP